MEPRHYTLWTYKRHAAHRLKEIYPLREADSLAMRMLEEVIHPEQTKLLACWHDNLSGDHRKRLDIMLDELLRGTPIQHIIGYAWFDGLRIKVTPNTLIPRPETECLVEEAVSLLSRQNKGKTVLDLGTGSGCIAIAIKRRMPAAEVDASDICANALKVAAENARNHLTSIGFVCDDMLSPRRDKYHKHGYDLIVSNPPYIPQWEKALMHKNVLEHEPGGALFVPDHDPLLYYRAILTLAGDLLRPEGAVIMEIHEHKAQEMKALCVDLGYKKIRQVNDLADKPRIFVVSPGA